MVKARGEEDEETTHTVKAKVFEVLKTSDNLKSEWKELGIGQIGMFRLKKHKKMSL